MATNSKVGVWNRALRRIGESESLETESDDRPAADACRLYYDDCLREVLEAKPWPMLRREVPLSEISSQVVRYDGTGSQTVFNIPYAFLSTTQVAVELIDSSGTATIQTAGTDYTVKPAIPSQGVEAEVTMASAPAADEDVRITVTTSRVGWTNLYQLPPDCVTPVALLTQGERIDLTPENMKEEFDRVINDAGDGYMLCCNVDDVEAFEYVAYIDNVLAWPALFLDAVVFRLAAELALDIRKDPQLAGQMMQLAMVAIDRAYAMARNARHKTPELPQTPLLASRG